MQSQRLSDCCCATSSIAAARLTHVHETDIYFRAILRSNWRCCGGNLTQREGKGVSRRNTEQQIIMHYQSMKPWIDYLIVIFDFGYLNVFSFSIFVRLCGEDTFCSFPKVVLWTLSVCTRVTVRTRFCRTPLVSHPCLDPHPIVSTAKNLVLLLCQFFSARKIFCHVFFCCCCCSFPRWQLSYNLVTCREKWIFFFIAIPFSPSLGFLGKSD